MLLDYAKEVITVKGKGLDLGAFPDGPQPVAVTIEIDGVEVQTTAVRMVRKRKALKY